MKKTYKPVIERVPGIGGIQRIYQFDNGYGASAVDETHYGWDMHHYIGQDYELAVIFFTKPSGWEKYKIVCDTDVTDDVERYQTWEQIQELLEKIEALPLRRVEDAPR